MCQRCQPPVHLCEGCHKAFVDAGRHAPEGFKVIAELEERVQRVRTAMPGDLDLLALLYYR
jgi:hypothetical protein